MLRFLRLSGIRISPGNVRRFGFLRHTVVQHVIFWGLYFLFNVIRWGLYFDDFEYSFQSNLVEFSIHLIIVYFNLNFLIPRFFPDKLLRYVTSLLLANLVVSSARILLTYQLVTTEIWKEASVSGLGLFDPNYFIAVYIGEIYVVGFTMAIKLGIDYVSSINKRRELENKKMEAELSFLRSQIQPHFFFNTLNNLYSLSLRKDRKAPEMILKLSELMSYVIYEGKSRYVSLKQEIKHIQDYVDLEKLRYMDKLEVTMEITGNVEKYSMPPLILVPFVENCFKHGNTNSDKIPILIKIDVKDDRLEYVVKNEPGDRKKNNVPRKDLRSGIGLKNAKRRLHLLFHDDYSLNVDQGKKTFTITLSMPLYDKVSDN